MTTREYGQSNIIRGLGDPASTAPDGTTFYDDTNAAMPAKWVCFGNVWTPLTPIGARAVANLPAAAAGNLGWRGTATNSNAALTAGIGAVVAGGGASVVPVFSDGTNWRIG